MQQAARSLLFSERRYSTHSWLGMATLTLFALQYFVAAYAYLYPKISLAKRRALGPVHIFLGKAILAAGCATMAVRAELVACMRALAPLTPLITLH